MYFSHCYRYVMHVSITHYKLEFLRLYYIISRWTLLLYIGPYLFVCFLFVCLFVLFCCCFLLFLFLFFVIYYCYNSFYFISFHSIFCYFDEEFQKRMLKCNFTKVDCTWDYIINCTKVVDLKPRGGGGYCHRNAIRWRAAQMGRFLTKNPLNMGPIFDPQIPKHGSIFRQNHKHGYLFYL